ncbi:MAG: AAA family ATPase [Spirochaetales bacterium]
MIRCESSYRKIIPIASGKGGVGKTVLTANLGIALGKAGFRTLLVDLDLGGSNLHSVLGIKNKFPGIGNFLSGKSLSFKEIILRTEYPNVFFIPGDVLVTGTADLMYTQRKRIIDNLMKIEADYILLDLGSGTHSTTLDFFLSSNAGLLVAIPQVPSILNSYSFLKNALFRLLTRIFSKNKEVAEYLKQIQKEVQPNSIPSISKILKEVKKLDAEGSGQARQFLQAFKPHLIVNMAKDPGDLAIVESLRNLVQKNLEIPFGCLGIVFRDERIQESINQMRPAVWLDPDSLPAKQISRMAEKILQSKNFPDLPLDLSEYKDSFELAEIEAHYDLAEVSSAENEKKQEEALTPEEFITVLTAQQKKINELQGTIRMLTLRGKQEQ